MMNRALGPYSDCPTHCVQGPYPASQRTASYLRSGWLKGRHYVSGSRKGAIYRALHTEVLVSFLEIVFFIALDHEFVEDDNVGIGQTLDRLDTEAHDGMTMLDNLDIPSATRHTVDTLSG